MCQRRAPHRLRHAKAVARVARGAEALDFRAERVGAKALCVEFVAARRDDDGAVGADVDALACVLGDDAHDFAVAADEFESGRLEHDFDLADFFDGVAVLVKEHVAAALLAADAPLVDRVGAGEGGKAGVAVDHELGVGLEAFDEGLGTLDFLAEDVEERFVLFAVGKGVGGVEVGVGVLGVLWDHEAARGDGRVAAALRELFKNEDLGARVVGFNGRTGAGTAVAENDDVGRLVPFQVLRVFHGLDAGDGERQSGGETAAKHVSTLQIHDVLLSKSVGRVVVTARRCRGIRGSCRTRASGASGPSGR